MNASSMTRHDHLRRHLTDYVPADSREHTHRTRMLHLLDATSEPFSRDQYVPGHITASAFVLDPSGSALLLILHSKLGLWLQPGGHVEPEDLDIVHSARREVLEEVGIRELSQVGGVLDVDVHTFPARKDKPAHEHFDVRFLFQAADLAFTAGSDASAARWVPIASLLNAAAGTGEALPSDESVLRAVRKLREVL